MTSTLIREFDRIVQYEVPYNELNNCTVFITGGTGLIGSLIIKFCHYLNKVKQMNIKIVALVRNVEDAKSKLSGIEVEFIQGDVNYPITYNGIIDYIIHCAANTNSKEMIVNPVGNIETAVFGTSQLLKLACQHPIKSFIYLSSMEVYGVTDPMLASVTEPDLGYIDLRNIRNGYGESKRICELLCQSYYAQYNVPVKMVRLAQTFGSGVDKSDTRVFAQFARSVIFKQDIILHTDGSSTGNYCDTSDVVYALILILLKGSNGETYNVANEALHMTIKEMADLVVRDIAKGSISMKIEMPANGQNYGYAPPVKMKLNTKKIRELGWCPTVNMVKMYESMIREFTNGN